MYTILSQTRVKTALVLFLAALVIGFIDSFFLTWLTLGFIMLFTLHEAMKLLNVEYDSLYFYAAIVWLFGYFYPKPEDLVFIVAIIFASILAYTKNFELKYFTPLFYPLVSFLFLLSLYSGYGMGALFWLIVIVAGTDIGAYYVGRSFGSTPFCQTSPNKTLEGVIGGVATATVLGIIFAIEGVGFFEAFIISAFVSLASVFGDLFESYLKREADVKDSGDILPGHGGVLDRVDGYLFGVIVLVILLRFFH